MVENVWIMVFPADFYLTVVLKVLKVLRPSPPTAALCSRRAGEHPDLQVQH
jgi:hypothetical protein